MSFGEDYKSKLLTFRKLLLAECVCFVILTCIINFAFASATWPTSYIDTVVADYDLGPIVQVAQMDKGAGCDAWSMGSSDEYALHDGTSFEIVAKPYFWAVYQGCVCPGGGYAEAKRAACRPEELIAGCRDIPSFDAKSYDSANNKIVCARREYNLHHTADRVMPTKDANNEWTCPSGLKFCGSQESEAVSACVPDEYVCPITDVKFVNDILFTFTDTVDGLPIVDLKLSQGGPPCINFALDKNSITEDQEGYRKQHHLLFSDEYENGCTRITIDGMEFRESTDYQKVEGYTGVSEYDVLEEHERQSGVFSYKRLMDYMDYWGGFSKAQLMEYKYDMYERHYLNWECEGSRVHWMDEMDSMHNVLVSMKAVHTLLIIYLTVITFEQAFLFAHLEDALDKKVFDYMFYFSRILGFIFAVVIFIILCFDVTGAMASTEFTVSDEIDQTQCAGDQIIHAIVGAMKDYADSNLGSSPRLIFCILLLFGSTALMVGGFIYKLCVVKKAWDEDNSHEGGRSTRKRSQIKEPLMD